MSERDDRMFEEIIPVLLRELHCNRVEVRANHYRISLTAKNDILNGLYRRIRRIVSPSFSSLFLEYLNDADLLDLYFEDSDSDELEACRKEFTEKTTASGCAFLRERIPGLTDRIFRTYRQYHFVIGEMLERLDHSYDRICETVLGGRPFRKLTSLRTDCGDLHNGGRSAAVLTTDTGKIVYKPHDVGIDVCAGELIRQFFDDVMKTPAVFRGEDYGFSEYINNEPAVTEADAKKYFRNLGGFAAFVQMMGSADLHHSNVFSRGIYPVIIDYELLMTPSSRMPDQSLANDLKYSLLYSSLMPCRRGNIELSILFAQDEENRGAPVVDGIRRTIRDYPDDFFGGFTEIYRRCMERREEIRAMITSMDNLYVRHIYRTTRAYMDLLDKTLEPGWIRDPDLKNELVRQLSVAMKRSGSDNADAVTEAEASALISGDIPYLYTRTDSRDLYADHKVVYKDFFRVSCLDNACSRLDYLSEDDLAFETALLKKAMNRVIRRSPEPSSVRMNVKPEATITDDALLQEAEHIFHTVAEDVLITPSGELCWFGPDYFLETGMHVCDSGLGEGITGLAVFFAALSSLTKDSSVKAECLRLTDKLTDRLERMISDLKGAELIFPNVENISMMSGLAGKLLGCLLIGRYTQNERYEMLCGDILSLLAKMELRYEKPDMYSGLAGLLNVLCRYDDFFAYPGIAEFCGQLAERITGAASIPYRGKRIWRTLTPAWAISGAGHGQSGIASALTMAGRRLNRRDLIEAAEAGFAFEADIYSPEIRAWPDRRRYENTEDYMTGYCSGAPGIGMNAISVKYTGWQQMAERAIESTRQEPLQYKDFLCCGNCASIEFLLSAGTALNRGELIAEARSRMAMIIERAQNAGHYNCVNEAAQDVFAPGFLYGVSGIGYEILRLLAPDRIESVLL